MDKHHKETKKLRPISAIQFGVLIGRVRGIKKMIPYAGNVRNVTTDTEKLEK